MHASSKLLRIGLVSIVFIISTLSALAKMGFSCEAEIRSVAVSETKVVFVVSGKCSMLLPIESGPHGNATEITSVLHDGVIILYRTYDRFPSKTAWQDACKGFQGLAGKRQLFRTSDPHYVWEHDDLTLVSTGQLTVTDHP